jgi:DMSO/TMAO reductase YedYZ molybdopterin-dependent catalytic subunit
VTSERSDQQAGEGTAAPGVLRPAVAGLVTAAVALGVAELVAGLRRGGESPVITVGEEVIDAVPPAVKDFAISTFGTNDKVALLVGIGVLLALFGTLVGVVAVRRLAVGVAGVVLFGAVGVAAALARPDSGVADLAPSVVGALAGIVALRALVGALRPSAGRAGRTPAPAPARPSRATIDRRRFVTLGVGLAAVAAGTGAVGRVLSRGYRAAASRAAVLLPAARRPLPPLPAGADLGIEGLSPFTTPLDDFYRIDTALLVPQLTTEGWSLRVHGMVDRELVLSWEDLLARPLVEADITMTCVSNVVGGDLVGNSRWLGVRLDEVLADAGVRPGATQLVSRSSDGWSCGFPTEDALDGRDALIAVAMDGEPLPVEHGFPARLVVPGLYGYVSATKWLTEIELTTMEAFDGYWVQRSWAKEAPVKTSSRIDVPRSFDRLPPGRTAVAGVAWAQRRGVERVEVRVDDGPWVEARLADVPGPDTWRQWVHEWDATPGRHNLAVRATDGTGATQPEERVEPVPDGATGWHTVVVTVGEA